MSTSPLVSIIVPVFNAQKYLHACVDSILRQEYSNIEVVLINDGSTDDSSIICRDYADVDGRVRFVDKAREGVSAARNKGLEVASGVWCLFVDADDAILPSYVRNFVSHAEGDEDLVISGLQRVNRHTCEVMWVNQFADSVIDLRTPSSKVILDNILRYGAVCGKMYSLKLIRKYGLTFDENLSLHEDNVFYLNYILHVNTIILSSATDYIYYSDSNAVSLSTNAIHSEEVRINAYNSLLLAYKLFLRRAGVAMSDCPQMSSFVVSIMVGIIKERCLTMNFDAAGGSVLFSEEVLTSISRFYLPRTLNACLFKACVSLFVKLRYVR